MSYERLSGGPALREQVDFRSASLHVRRAKNGTTATHPLSGLEMRELRRRQRESSASPFVFVSETRCAAIGVRVLPHGRAGGPLGQSGYQGARPHAAACLRLQASQRRTRYACNADYLGHRNIQNATRYTVLAPQRFRKFFAD
jgi:hypothetical protein